MIADRGERIDLLLSCWRKRRRVKREELPPAYRLSFKDVSKRLIDECIPKRVDKRGCIVSMKIEEVSLRQRRRHCRKLLAQTGMSSGRRWSVGSARERGRAGSVRGVFFLPLLLLGTLLWRVLVWVHGMVMPGTGKLVLPPPSPAYAGAWRGSVHIRALRTAIVMIRCNESGPSYTEIVGLARSKIDLAELEIAVTRIRKAQMVFS